MNAVNPALSRAQAFSESLGIQIPILMAPMAGACPAALAIAVGNAGGMGGCGALLLQPEEIDAWAAETRSGTNGAFQMNVWIPDPPADRDVEREAAIRAFLAEWGPQVPDDAAERPMPDFGAQCEAMLEANPAVISSIMGVYPPEFVARMKARNIRWFATVTTVAEAKLAESAGADVIVAQGMEAGGHRGAFEAADAEAAMVGLFSLLPAVVDAVDAPVVATGGIADARGVAAALMLGASAVQIGTALLRSPEAGISRPWSEAIGRARPEGTIGTRAFSGRLGRGLRGAYAVAAASEGAPKPMPYPIQMALTQAMRAEAIQNDDVDRMPAWAGQSAGLARVAPAHVIVSDLWEGTRELLAP